MEDGVKCLYLDGSGARATTPAVDFGRASLTIASWVKLQSPVLAKTPIYSCWSAPLRFLFDYFNNNTIRFIIQNNKGKYEPHIKGG